MTKRQAINSFRDELNKRNADNNYSNQFLYNELLKQAKWLIRREISAGRIYKNTHFFRTLKCQNVIETSVIDSCCPIKSNCKIYRTECELPDIWIDNDGPIIKNISSIDGPVIGSTEFTLISPSAWMNKQKDPYQQKSKELYAFYANGYIWFPNVNPHKVNIHAFWQDDVRQLDGCGTGDCIQFLDTEFLVPGWVEAEMFAKALELLLNSKERIPNDEQIDKNTTRRS